MNAWLFHFFGLPEAARVSWGGIRFRNPEMLGWMVLLLMPLGGLAWWAYFRQPGTLPPGRKRLLAGLRFLLFLLISLLLLQPVVELDLENRVHPAITVLVDATLSMNMRDPRTEEIDLKRAELAAGALSSIDQKLDPARVSEARQISRAELAADVFRNRQWHLQDDLSRNFQVQVLTFGEGPVPSAQGAGWLDRYRPGGKSTALGDAVRDVIGQPQRPSGIFLVTDGGNNSGSSPQEAAELAGREGVPLYIYGTGLSSPRDIAVSGLDAPEIGFAGDEMAVSVQVRGQGLAGEKGRLVLKLGDEEVAARDVVFTGQEQTVPLSFAPKTAGRFALTASIAPRPDEASRENNAASRPVRIIDDRIKVLYVERAPRWEFRFLQTALLRDRRVQAAFVLEEGDAALTQNPPYLAKFPAEKEALFKYDLLILGDVDPKVFTAAQLDAMGEFVSKFGGACLFLAGRNFMPEAYRGSVVEKMLPVGLAPPAKEEQSEREIHLALTPLGGESGMLRLAAGAAANGALWSRLPPILWDYHAGAPKPAAQVLLEDPDPALATRFGKMPVFVTQQYGVGQVLYLGTDNLWRWRQNDGVEQYARLWGQIVQGAAMAHLLGGSKRTQLASDKQEYTVGEPVTIFARLYDAAFQPLEHAGGVMKREGGEAEPLELRQVPGQPGMFRGSFAALKPGRYQFATTGDANTKLEFSVNEPRYEMGETAMNEALLRQMARASGGRFFREEDLAGLVPAMAARPPTEKARVEGEIWSSPFYFVLMCAVATAEWIVRKRSNLR